MIGFLRQRISIRPGGTKRAFTLSLTGAFLFTNVLTPYAAEKSFWTERQKTVQKMKQDSDLMGTLASINVGNGFKPFPTKQPVSHLNKEQSELLAQLPQVTKTLLPSNVTTSVIASVAKQSQAPGAREIATSPLATRNDDKRYNTITQNASKAWLSAILPYGSIGDIYISKSPTAPLVVHIQDVHGNLEAQKNIANIINVVAQSPITDFGDRPIERRSDGTTTTPDKSGNYNEHNNASVVMGLEGAAGGFNIHPYRNFPDTEVTKDIAKYFLKERYIGGPEFAALTTPETPFLWGVEDLPLYEKNIQTIYDSQKNKPQLLAILNELKKSVANLKEKVYSPQLKEFDQHFNAYKNDQEKLGAYVRYLLSVGVNTNVDTITTPDKSGNYSKRSPNVVAQFTRGEPVESIERRYPNLNLLVRALSLEETLDFKVVEQERLQLIETLVKKLTQKQLTKLVQESINYKLGYLNYGEYHQYLKQLCKNNGIPIRNFAKLNSYINYVGLAERINRNKLLDELTKLEEQVQNSLAITSEQKRLVAANKSLIMLQKLANHEMTTDDWDYYEHNRDSILASLSVIAKPSAVIASTAKQSHISTNLEKASADSSQPRNDKEIIGLSELLIPFEDFCRYATERNSVLVENLLGQVKSTTERDRVQQVKSETGKGKDKEKNSYKKSTLNSNSSVSTSAFTYPLSVLIAGGFHTQGITQILRQKDVSYVVVTPKITEVPKDNHYLDVFARKPLPLEKLFAGEKIFVVHPIRSAWNSVRGFEGTVKVFRKAWIFSESLAQIHKQIQKHPSDEKTLSQTIEQAEKSADDLGIDMNIGKNGIRSEEHIFTSVEIEQGEEGENKPDVIGVATSSSKRMVGKNVLVKNGFIWEGDESVVEIGDTVLQFGISSPVRHRRATLAKTVTTIATGAKFVLAKPKEFNDFINDTLKLNRAARSPVQVIIGILTFTGIGAFVIPTLGSSAGGVVGSALVVLGVAALFSGHIAAIMHHIWLSKVDKIVRMKSTQKVNKIPTETKNKSIISIPETAFNVLEIKAISEAINRLFNEANNPQSDLGMEIAKIKNNKMFLPFHEHSEFLKRAGAKAGLKGPVVYYPFGGFDPYTPFTTVQDAINVFAMGWEYFGSLADITNFIDKGLLEHKAGAQYAPFDYIFDLGMMKLRNKLEIGLGALAIARIISFIGGMVDGLYYFNIEADGNIKFLSEIEIADKGNNKNAVIEFTDKNGQTKRYWYIQDDVNENSPGFEKFIEALTFQTLFIKSPLSMWDSGLINRKKSIEKTLNPAKKNKALVFTDQRITPEGSMIHHLGQHPIWEPGYKPEEIVLQDNEDFGYSHEGDSVYYGPAEKLIDVNTPTNLITNYMGSDALALTLQYTYKFWKAVFKALLKFTTLGLISNDKAAKLVNSRAAELIIEILFAWWFPLEIVLSLHPEKFFNAHPQRTAKQWAGARAIFIATVTAGLAGTLFLALPHLFLASNITLELAKNIVLKEIFLPAVIANMATHALYNIAARTVFQVKRNLDQDILLRQFMFLPATRVHNRFTSVLTVIGLAALLSLTGLSGLAMATETGVSETINQLLTTDTIIVIIASLIIWATINPYKILEYQILQWWNSYIKLWLLGRFHKTTQQTQFDDGGSSAAIKERFRKYLEAERQQKSSKFQNYLDSLPRPPIEPWSYTPELSDANRELAPPVQYELQNEPLAINLNQNPSAIVSVNNHKLVFELKNGVLYFGAEDWPLHEMKGPDVYRYKTDNLNLAITLDRQKHVTITNLPDHLFRDSAGPKNITSGTIGEKNHEEINKLLQKQFDTVRNIYNDKFPKNVKKEGLGIRDTIQSVDLITEMEADLALAYSGYLAPNEFRKLQDLRNNIRNSFYYDRAKAIAGKDIKIFFIPPETNTELFWHENEYAAGHFSTVGARIHISLPLAIRDAHKLISGRPLSGRLLSVNVGIHELKHIAQGQHDSSLDNTLEEIAKKDIERLKIARPQIIISADEAEETELELSKVVKVDERMESMTALHEKTKEGGWHSVVLNVDNLPADLANIFNETKMDVFGTKVSFFDILRISADKIIFAPHLMRYRSTTGEKMEHTMQELILESPHLLDSLFKSDKRVIIVETLKASDALKTGARIDVNNIHEISIYIAREIGQLIIYRLVEDKKISEFYLRNELLFERSILSLIRAFLVDYSEHLAKTYPEDTEIQELIKSDFKERLIPETEAIIKVNNRELGIAEDFWDVPPEIIQQIASYKTPPATEPTPSLEGVEEVPAEPSKRLRPGFILDWLFNLFNLSKDHWFYKVSAIGLGPLVETIILHAWVFDPTGLSAGSLLLSGMIFSIIHLDVWIDLLFRKAGDKKKISFGQFLDIVAIRAIGGMAFIALLYIPGTIHIPFLGTLSLPSFGVHAFLLNLPIVLWINKQISEGKILSKVIRPFFAAEPSSSSSLDDLKTVIERVFSKEGKYNQKLQNLLDLMADKVLENQDFTDSFSTSRGRYELSVTAIAIHNAPVPQGLLRIRITMPLYQQQSLNEEEIETINRYLFLLTVEFNTGEKTTDIITFTRLEPAEWIPAQSGYKSMEAFLAFDASGQVMNADLHGIRQNYPASNQQVVPLTVKLRINREEALSQIRTLRQYLGQADQEFRAGNLDEADRLVRIVLQGSPENNITGLNEFSRSSPARWYPPAAHSIFSINTAITELAKEIKTLKMWAELLSKLPETAMSEAGEIATNLQTMFSQFTPRNKRIAINLVSLILLPVLRNLRIKLIARNNRIDENDISIYEHTMFGFMSILPNSPQDPFYTETASLLGTAEQITEEIKRLSMEIMKKKTRLSPGEREKALNLAREHVDQNKGQELIELFSYSELADYVLFEWVEKDITRYEQAIDLLIDGYIKPNTIRVDKTLFYHFEGRLQTAIDTIQQRIDYWQVVPELIDNDFLNKAAALIESLRSLNEDTSGQQPEFMPEGSGVIPVLQKFIVKHFGEKHPQVKDDQYYRQKVAPWLETGLFTLPLYIGIIVLAAFGIFPDIRLLLTINAMEWLVVLPLLHIFPQRAPLQDIFAATVKIAPLTLIITSIPLILQPFLGHVLSLLAMSASYWLANKWHTQINTPSLSQEAKSEPENISKFAPQLFNGDQDSDKATVDAAQAESEVKNPLLGLRDLEVRNVIHEILLFYNQKYEHPVPEELVSSILDTIAKHAGDPAAALNAVYTEITNPRQTGSLIYLAYNNPSYRLHTKLQSQLELIRHLLPDSGVIVNVGAGDNALANYIIREKPGLTKYIGTDVLDYSVEPIVPERIKYFPQDRPDKLPEEIEDASADTVIMIAVLHHTGQFAPALLQEVRRILKPGGRLIVYEDTWSDQIPPKFVTNPLEKFLALQPSQRYAILEFIDWYANHFIKGIFEMPLPLGFKTLEDWSSFLTEQGFQVEQTEFFGFPDLPFSPRPPQGVIVLKKPDDRKLERPSDKNLQPEHIKKKYTQGRKRLSRKVEMAILLVGEATEAIASEPEMADDGIRRQIISIFTNNYNPGTRRFRLSGLIKELGQKEIIGHERALELVNVWLSNNYNLTIALFEEEEGHVMVRFDGDPADISKFVPKLFDSDGDFGDATVGAAQLHNDEITNFLTEYPRMQETFGRGYVESHWKDLVQLGTQAEEYESYLFLYGLPDLKDTFGIEWIESNWKNLVQLGTQAGEYVSLLFSSGLPALKEIITPDNLMLIGGDLIKLGTVAGKYTRFLFEYGLPPLKKIITPDNLMLIGSGLLQLGTQAGEHIYDLFSGDLPAMRNIFGIKWIESNWKNLVQLGTQAGKYVELLFSSGLPALKEIIMPDNLMLIGGDLIKLGTVAGKYTRFLFEDDMRALKRAFGINWVESNWKDFVSHLSAIMEYTTDYNRERILKLVFKKHLVLLDKKHADLFMPHLEFFEKVMTANKRLAYQLMDDIVEGMKVGAVDIVLPETEQDKIMSFIEKLHNFSPLLFKVYKQRGEQALDDLFKFAAEILTDDIGKKEIEMLLDEYRQPGFNDLDILSAAIQIAITASGASFVTREEINGLLEKFQMIGDLRTHIPDSLRNKDFGEGKKDAITIFGWSLKSGKTFDPEGKIAKLLSDLRYSDQDLSEQEVKQRKKEDEQQFLQALKDYFNDQNPQKQEALIEAFYNHAHHSDQLGEKIDRIQPDDYVGLELLEQLFVDKDNLSVLFKEVSDQIPQNLWPQTPIEKEKSINRPQKMLKQIEGIWNNQRDVQEKEQLIRNALGSSSPIEIEKKLLPRIRDTGLAELVRDISQEPPATRTLTFHELFENLFQSAIELIQQEKDKFERKELDRNVVLEFRVVKGIPYGLWGLNAGVCIATDIKLWENPNFFLLALIDKTQGKVVGFVHLFEAEIDGKKVLAMPGIEPSVEFLSEVKARDIYPLIEKTLIKIAQTGNYDALYLPTEENEGGIISNRPDIVKEVKRRKYKQIILTSPIKWNNEPKPYPFDKVYQIWHRGSGVIPLFMRWKIGPKPIEEENMPAYRIKEYDYRSKVAPKLEERINTLSITALTVTGYLLGFGPFISWFTANALTRLGFYGLHWLPGSYRAPPEDRQAALKIAGINFLLTSLPILLFSYLLPTHPILSFIITAIPTNLTAIFVHSHESSPQIGKLQSQIRNKLIQNRQQELQQPIQEAQKTIASPTPTQEPLSGLTDNDIQDLPENIKVFLKQFLGKTTITVYVKRKGQTMKGTVMPVKKILEGIKTGEITLSTISEKEQWLTKGELKKKGGGAPSRYGLVNFIPIFGLLEVSNQAHRKVISNLIAELKNSGALGKDSVIDTSKDDWVDKLSSVSILLPLELHKELFSAVFNAAGNIFLPAGKNTEFEVAISKAVTEVKAFGAEIKTEKIHIIRGPPESELSKNVLAALKEARTDKLILWTTDGHILIHEDTIRNWQEEKLDLVTEFTKTIIHENHEYQRYQEALKDLKPGESITEKQVKRWHKEAEQREMLVMPKIAEIKTVTEEQENDIKAWYRALLEQLLFGGEARPVDFEPVLRFDVVKYNIEIGKLSTVDQSKAENWNAFVANWINILEKINSSLLSVNQNGNKDVLNNIYTSPLKFARALIRARKDPNFRQLVALDILEKVQKAKDNKRLYENILSEVALLRASGSSLFGELDGKGNTQTRDYLGQDIDFLIQLYFMSGLAENKSAKEVREHLDILFNMYNDQILRRAVTFDAVEQLFNLEGSKNDSNLMVFDVSELLSDKDIDIKKEPRKLMADSLIYLAAKLQEAPESIAGSVTLISNHKNMNDRDILNNLVAMSSNYRGLDDAANILKDNLGRKVIFKTTDMNKKLLNHDNRISLNTLRALLANSYSVTAMEVYGLNTKETLDETGIDISLKIIDLVTNATAEFQRKLKETRFVEIQA